MHGIMTHVYILLRTVCQCIQDLLFPVQPNTNTFNFRAERIHSMMIRPSIRVEIKL